MRRIFSNAHLAERRKPRRAFSWGANTVAHSRPRKVVSTAVGRAHWLAFRHRAVNADFARRDTAAKAFVPCSCSPPHAHKYRAAKAMRSHGIALMLCSVCSSRLMQRTMLKPKGSRAAIGYHGGRGRAHDRPNVVGIMP